MPSPKGVVATNPGRFFDAMLVRAGLINDAALGRAVKISAPSISKMRQGHNPIGVTLILALHETFGIPVADMRAEMAA